MLDLAKSPKSWDSSFPDLPVPVCKQGLVFVKAVNRFYSIGGMLASTSPTNSVYYIAPSGSNLWTPSGNLMLILQALNLKLLLIFALTFQL